MRYDELKQKQREEIESFPMVCAFTLNQLAKGLKEMGWNKNDLINTGGGVFIHRDSKEEFLGLFKRHSDEMKKAMQDDSFLKEAILYELGNHEYGYTHDPTDTLDALDMTLDDERTARIFKEAKAQYLE